MIYKMSMSIAPAASFHYTEQSREHLLESVADLDQQRS